MKAFIKNISCYLPEKILTNNDLAAEFPEWPAEKIAKKIGIEKRHLAAENETAADMAVKAAEKLFSQGVDKTDIDYLLFCTQSPDYKLPTSACIIQNRLGLATSTGALDFNLGCSGYVYGLSLAKGLVVSGIAKNVLLLTAETYSKFINRQDKGNRTIFGDAAAATVISTDGFAEIGEFVFGTDGSGAESLILKSGGSRLPEKQNVQEVSEDGNIISPDYLYMDGATIFSFTLKEVPKLVAQTLEKNDIGKDSVGLFIFHQANKYMLDFLQKKMNIENEKFFVNLENVGNTVSNTIPIAIIDAGKQNLLHPGMNIILAGFGVGLSWVGCKITIRQAAL